MKKICTLLLLGVVCISLSGCAEVIIKGGWSLSTGVSQMEQKAMLKHLEKKYGEKFVIEEIHLPDNVASLDRGATVYPEGREDEAFYVNLGTKGSRKVLDYYVFREPEKRMQVLYEEWIQHVIPTAKVSIELSVRPSSKELLYNPDETLQQFVSQTDQMSIDVDILLSEAMLEEKDEIFEKLSNLPGTEPITGFWHNHFDIGFLLQEVFEDLPSDEYKHIPSYLEPFGDEDAYMKEVAKDFVAVTSFGYPTQWAIIDLLNDEFETKEE